MKQKLLGFIAYLIVRVIGMTLRIRLHYKNEKDREFFETARRLSSPNDSHQFLMAFWHQDELCLMNYFRNKRIGVLISISKDGQIMNTTAQLLGYTTIRGSSSKKAVSGLLAAIKKAKEGYSLSFAVDGPRGPIYQVKEGICAVSKKSQLPIVPIRAHCSKAKIFTKSWNQAKFPLPFSRIDLYVGSIAQHTSNELEAELKSLD
ncbi:MAG: hypothetical protein CME62_16880 [Halobacteriovoraceae bacterium]|nr:hypothetical protein [Halobacteriovoraceae bacterium]|tara:strand:+ start:17715 stop:18326 length:612 start_codon:yes stop_codon:yes gene_type:complete